MKWQEIVALSTTESEYIALTRAAQQVLWVGGVLAELGYDPETVPVVARGDNQGALGLAKNTEFHPRTKHIAVRYHWIRDLLKAVLVQVEYVQSAMMLADMMTKPLDKVKFEQAQSRMGLVRVQVPKNPARNASVGLLEILLHRCRLLPFETIQGIVFDRE